jgi:glycine/D-amino acid oxidase-like deaminating enzyme
MVDFDTLVVGGGFYGCMVASHVAERGERVLLVEQQTHLMHHASMIHPSRVLHLYHDALVGGSASSHHAARFLTEFRDSIVNHFTQFYALGRAGSKVTPGQFYHYLRHLGVPIAPAPEAVHRLFDSAYIETVFRVEEPLFDTAHLRQQMEQRLAEARVELAKSTTAEQVVPQKNGTLRVTLASTDTKHTISVQKVFNCAHAQLNTLLERSQLALIPLVHELTEMVVVDVPSALRGAGITILSGPFFSLLPFPALGQHTLSQARFSPHPSWGDLGLDGPAPREILASVARQTGFERMRREASRYMPSLGELRYLRSLWTIRSRLPDGKRTLLRSAVGAPNLHCLLGTRIMDIYDILEAIDSVWPGPVLAAC